VALVRDLRLSKQQAQIIDPGLQQWNLLASGTKYQHLEIARVIGILRDANFSVVRKDKRPNVGTRIAVQPW
jgi:hypothetical protein